MLPHHAPQRPWVWGCRVFHWRGHNSYELKKILYFSSLFLTTKPTVIIHTVQIIPTISVNKTEGSHLFQLFISIREATVTACQTWDKIYPRCSLPRILSLKRLNLTFDPTRQTAAGFPLKGLLVKASITNNERTLLSSASAILLLIFTLSLPVSERAKKCTGTSRGSGAHLEQPTRRVAKTGQTGWEILDGYLQITRYEMTHALLSLDPIARAEDFRCT